jgi:rubrerythrin
LKNGFQAEAASAARFRAVAARAEREGRPNLARRMRDLATEKDALAVAQYEAAEAIRHPHEDLRAEVAAAAAEERFENDALYPKMLRDRAVDEGTAKVLEDVVARQQQHAAQLDALLDALTRSQGDVPT